MSWKFVRTLFAITLLLLAVGVIHKDVGVEFMLGGSFFGFSLFTVYLKCIINKAYYLKRPISKLWNILLLIFLILSIWMIPFEGTTITDIYENILERDTALFHVRCIVGVALLGLSLLGLIGNFVYWQMYKVWEEED